MEATRNERKDEDEAQEVEMNVRKITNLLKPFRKEHMFEILSHAVSKYPDLLEYTEKVAENNPAYRNLLVSGLGPNTTSETLNSIFSLYGELEECKVIMDEDIGRSKGYAFVTYKHMEGLQRALKDPCKRIDRRYTLCQVCCEENKPVEPVIERMISVRNVPSYIHDEMLSIFFSKYGEIEAGPIRIGKKSRYALFIYVTVEGTRKALEDPLKTIDGHDMVCSMAINCSVDSSEVAPVNAINLTMPSVGAHHNFHPYEIQQLGSNNGFLSMNSQNIGVNWSTQGGVGSFEGGIYDLKYKGSNLLQSVYWEPQYVRPQFRPQIGHSNNQHSTMTSSIALPGLYSFHNQQPVNTPIPRPSYSPMPAYLQMPAFQTGMNAYSSSPHLPNTLNNPIFHPSYLPMSSYLPIPAAQTGMNAYTSSPLPLFSTPQHHSHSAEGSSAPPL